MKKLLIGTALLFAALPFTLDGVTPAVSKAQAAHRQRVVIPLTQAPGWGLPTAHWNPPAGPFPTPHWNAPIYAYAGPVPLYNPSARYGCYPAPFGQSFHYCVPRD
jgi:hypothetical protein